MHDLSSALIQKSATKVRVSKDGGDLMLQDAILPFGQGGLLGMRPIKACFKTYALVRKRTEGARTRGLDDQLSERAE
jgi:hypothetical protein